MTHRCHQKAFLLKFARDRERWLYWLFQARKRFGLCVLNYTVTSNHIHLLIKDRGQREIAKSMQLIAGRTAQEYNQRKGRVGAYWQDRYHATAVDTEGYLARCLVYIDLNMVRAGAISHPAQWGICDYREIQNPPQRYRIIDLQALAALLGISGLQELRRAHATWVEEALKAEAQTRDGSWSESLVIGGRAFVEQIQSELGIGARHRDILGDGDRHQLQETPARYGEVFGLEMGGLSVNNTVAMISWPKWPLQGPKMWFFWISSPNFQ